MKKIVSSDFASEEDIKHYFEKSFLVSGNWRVVFWSMTHSLNYVFFKLFETGDIEITECDYLIPEYSDPVSEDIRRRWDNIAEEFRGKQIKEL